MEKVDISKNNSEYWQLTFSVLLVMMCFIAAMFYLASPIQAYQWWNIPFPGFIIEQTLLIGSHNGEAWEARHRVEDLNRVLDIDNQTLDSPEDFKTILGTHSPGDLINVNTVSKDGLETYLQQIRLIRFPIGDFFRLFWLPYIIGFIYLVLGIGVYIRRGYLPSGKAFVYFCISISISTVLLFDLVSTHLWVDFWSTGISQLGAAAILLALTFPEPADILKRYQWLSVVPLLIALFFSVWCIRVNYNLANPWAYVAAWRSSFLYAVIGVIIFFVSLGIRLRKPSSPEIAQQLRITLWGGFFAFSPALVWLASPFIGEQLVWDPAIFLPLMMVFPVAVGAAIIRYRLWDLEIIINQTIVYSTLTLILGGIFVIGVLGSQLLMIGFLPRASMISVVLSSIAATLLFNPLRIRIQTFVDQRFFRHKYDVTQSLVAFQASVRNTIELETLTTGLDTIISNTMQPTSINLCTCNPGTDVPHFYIEEEDPMRTVLINAQDVVDIDKLAIRSPALEQLKKEKYRLTIPLVNQNELIGVVNLGAKRSGQPYTLDDRRFLMILAAQIAPALRIASLVKQYQEKVVEQERTRQELEIARLIQQSLLPHELPKLPGWDIAVHYQPARAVGGDFYDFFLDGDELVVVIGDVTDKGVPAALVMATTRSVLRGTARRKLNPGNALKHANEILVPEMFKSMFVTCFYMILNYRTGAVLFANAGHNLPLHRSRPGIVELHATGMPLGLMTNMVYDEFSTVIQIGDSVLLFSDGLVESHNATYEMFGDSKLEDIVRNEGSPLKLIETLVSAVHLHSGRIDDPEDDITLLCIQRQKPSVLESTS